MGLAEKRALAAYKNDKFPQWKPKLDSICGFDLGLEVNWDQIAKEGLSEEYKTSFDYNYFQPLVKALTSICADDIGKNSFKEKIKQITVTSARNFSSMKATVNGNVLNIDADPSYERSEAAIENNSKIIIQTLENAL